MTKFTKEQLIEIAQENVDVWQLAMETDSLAQKEYAAIRLRVAEIALAALTTEPVPQPELKMAELINKFYGRYPLDEFESDTERSAALGYFIAGAELQCFGEFINYADLMGDE